MCFFFLFALSFSPSLSFASFHLNKIPIATIIIQPDDGGKRLTKPTDDKRTDLSTYICSMYIYILYVDVTFSTYVCVSPYV